MQRAHTWNEHTSARYVAHCVHGIKYDISEADMWLESAHTHDMRWWWWWWRWCAQMTWRDDATDRSDGSFVRTTYTICYSNRRPTRDRSRSDQDENVWVEWFKFGISSTLIVVNVQCFPLIFLIHLLLIMRLVFSESGFIIIKSAMYVFVLPKAYSMVVILPWCWHFQLLSAFPSHLGYRINSIIFTCLWDCLNV